jgi:hypothetical protein
MTLARDHSIGINQYRDQSIGTGCMQKTVQPISVNVSATYWALRYAGQYSYDGTNVERRIANPELLLSALIPVAS